MRRRIWVVTLVGLIVSAGGSVVLGGTALTTQLVASGLTRPVYVTHVPGDETRAFIVEQPGRIRILDISQNPPVLLGTNFLDITSRVRDVGNEQGLLGLAFHPDYATNREFYVNYTNNSDDTVVARYTVPLATPNVADFNSEEILLTIFQPQGNHNGGWMEFGPDGFLYISTGDGGGAGDDDTGHDAAMGNGQSLQTLLGKILRLDVTTPPQTTGSRGIPLPYVIPPTNPFTGTVGCSDGCDEIWAYGLRNPWRPAFDSSTGDLYIADVGQDVWEEINFQPSSSTGGENWGWRCREGAHNFNFDPFCGALTLLDPIHEYSHGGSPFRCSITGGEVYRGCAIPDLQGTYFFADHCSNQIWSFVYTGVPPTVVERTVELDPPGPPGISGVSSFGRDAFGEVYICDLFGGEVFKIVPNGVPSQCPAPPANPALAAIPPHDVPKNRFISFMPNNGGAVNFRVRHLGSGRMQWVQAPLPGADAANSVSRLGGDGTESTRPVAQLWPAGAMHVTGCLIAPVEQYEVEATADGAVFSSALSVSTIPQPAPKFWADTNGPFMAGSWTGPDGLVNFTDVSGAVQSFQNLATKPPITWVDLAAVTADSDPNLTVNFADINAIINGFLGFTYPGLSPAACP